MTHIMNTLSFTDEGETIDYCRRHGVPIDMKRRVADFQITTIATDAPKDPEADRSMRLIAQKIEGMKYSEVFRTPLKLSYEMLLMLHTMGRITGVEQAPKELCPPPLERRASSSSRAIKPSAASPQPKLLAKPAELPTLFNRASAGGPEHPKA